MKPKNNCHPKKKKKKKNFCEGLQMRLKECWCEINLGHCLKTIELSFHSFMRDRVEIHTETKSCYQSQPAAIESWTGYLYQSLRPVIDEFPRDVFQFLVLLLLFFNRDCLMFVDPDCLCWLWKDTRPLLHWRRALSDSIKSDPSMKYHGNSGTCLMALDSIFNKILANGLECLAQMDLRCKETFTMGFKLDLFIDRMRMFWFVSKPKQSARFYTKPNKNKVHELNKIDVGTRMRNDAFIFHSTVCSNYSVFVVNVLAQVLLSQTLLILLISFQDQTPEEFVFYCFGHEIQQKKNKKKQKTKKKKIKKKKKKKNNKTKKKKGKEPFEWHLEKMWKKWHWLGKVGAHKNVNNWLN